MILFCCMCSFAVNAQSSKTEDAINQMVAAGKLKRMGNALAIVVDKPSDTVQLRKKYENVFKKPDGTNYEIQFFIDPKYTQNTKQVPVNKLPDNNPPVNNNLAGTPGTAVTGPVNNNSNDCCCSNMKVFEYKDTYSKNKTPDSFTEYNWTVPAGVTKIKIEVWSAGGDGWNEIKNRTNGGNDSIMVIKGGGGGGGAYGFAIIEITPGDMLIMKVPGGGSNFPLIIDFPNSRIGYLNLMSGMNAKESISNPVFNGKGGKLVTGSGIFSANSFFLSGTDGQVSWLSDYTNNRDNVNRTDWGGNPRIKLNDDFDINGGNGGDAPKSTHGGFGCLSFRASEFTYQNISAKDGGYPGCGGGGGVSFYNFYNGKGASGVVIIYY